MNQAFTPVRVGRYILPNRLVMAPMTRSRAKFDGTPGELAAEYYAQRASVGLIVTEGTQPSDDGQGYLATPGIYTPAHIAGWKKVTAAVHDRRGHIFIQIMHAGRMSHPDNTPHHRQAVAPSAIAPGAQMFTATGMKDIPAPRALTSEERAGPSPTSAVRRAPLSMLAPMVSRFTARTPISSSSSSPRAPTRAAMNMAAPSRTAPASPSRSSTRLPGRSARTGRPSACPPA
jgi:NADH:flavin oxidoreductase / NADH oxidase family